jgi:hypothetical protein
MLFQFFTEMRQNVARLEVKKNRSEVLESKSQNSSRSGSITQLVDPSTLRIGSPQRISGANSTVEVMSVTTDQPLENQLNPEPSSVDEQSELVISQINNPLANNSDADMTELLSGSEDEEETPDPPFNWADNI